MRKKTLFQVIIVLIALNIATLYLLQKDSSASNPIKKVDDKNVNTNDVVASIGDYSITYGDWINQLRDVHGESELKELINKELVRQAGKEKEITVDEKIIERDIALLATMQHGLAEEEMEKEKERWKKQIVHRYTLEALLTDGQTVDEDKVKDYYDTYKNQYNFKESVQISHILVSDMEEAAQVKGELDDGAPFELLAQEYSLDDDTKNNGGYLGHLSSSSQFMPEGYFKKAKALESFSYSEPFEVDQGAAILYLHEHYPSYEFTYDELQPYIEREFILKDTEEIMKSTDLWEAYDVEWLYE